MSTENKEKLLLEESIFKDNKIGVIERYIYGFLKAILAENGYIHKDFVRSKVNEKIIGKKLKLRILTFKPFPIPSTPIFDNRLSPEEKGLLMTPQASNKKDS